MMEEKTTAKTRLNDIMNRKVNMDFLKNMNLPPIKMPKIKSRKIFNAKAPTKTDNVVPLPESTCIDRSPSRISMVSSLVNNDPEPDYNSGFGRLTVTQSEFDIRPDVEKDNKFSRTRENSSHKPLSFSDKVSKQYKDFSEFKFRHILSKKTVVRQTTIDVADYTPKPDDVSSERSDYDFEFHSLPPSKFGQREGLMDDDDDESVRGLYSKPSSREDSIESNEGPSQPRRAYGVQKESSTEPNKSSIFKQMKSMSIKRMSSSTAKETGERTIDDKHTEDNLKSSKRTGISKMSFNRQTIEDACSKAKSSVSHQFQKLKNIQTRRQHGEPTTPGEGKYIKKQNPEVIFPNITYNTETDGVVRSLSPPDASSRPTSRCYTDRPRRQDSLGSINAFPGRFLRQQSSFDESEKRTPPPKYAAPIRALEEIEVEPVTLPVGVYQLGDNFQCARRSRPIQVPIPVPPVDPPQFSWELFKVGQLAKQPSLSSSGHSSVKISRPAPPLPPGKPTVNTPLESVTKTEMIRRRFFQKLDDSLDTNINASTESQDSESWIPNVFSGPSQNQISFKSTDDNRNVWSKIHKKPVLQKSLSVDIFDPDVEEPFNDFDEELKNVPTVEVDSISTVVPEHALSATHAGCSSVAQKNPLHVQEKPPAKQITIIKSEVDSTNLSARNNKFSRILSRFENNTVGNIPNDNESFIQELACTYEITNVIKNSEYIRPAIKITKDSPESVKTSKNSSYRGLPLPPPPPPPASSKPQTPVKSVFAIEKTTENRLSDLSAEIEAAKELQQKILDEVSKEQSQLATDDRPFLKKFLRNEVTLSTLCDELDEDVFHSLDYDDAAPNDAKPLTHRKSIRVVYTAEV